MTQCKHEIFPKEACDMCRNPTTKPWESGATKWAKSPANPANQQPTDKATLRSNQVAKCPACNVRLRFVEQRMCNKCHRRNQIHNVVMAELFVEMLQDNPHWEKVPKDRPYVGTLEFSALAAMGHNAYLHRRATAGIPREDSPTYTRPRPPWTPEKKRG